MLARKAMRKQEMAEEMQVAATRLCFTCALQAMKPGSSTNLQSTVPFSGPVQSSTLQGWCRRGE
jgi:hypothetical protein